MVLELMPLIATGNKVTRVEHPRHLEEMHSNPILLEAH